LDIDDYGYYGLLTVMRSMGEISDGEWQELTASWDNSDSEEEQAAEPQPEPEDAAAAPPDPYCS
jgi:hypothetical protein